LLGIPSSAADQFLCAQIYAREEIAAPDVVFRRATHQANGRLRLAYLSADFHRHATAVLISELLELHERSGFEVVGVSFGPDDGSDTRKRIIAAFDRHIEIAGKNDEDAARLIADLGTDIAIDLKGHTKDARPGILAYRPAPIQVNYLGYPGTMGVPYLDYIMADPIVLPFDQQAHFSEKIVHLPDCYQVNDRKRQIASHTPTREELGLPPKGFVFCCFNNSWKITPTVFDVWMRLLQAVEGSVLWLLRDNEIAETNLRREAASRGIDPARLIFAGRLPLAEHLARHRLADLFLDTLPYNAHTTASDALWAGLPVITCRGETFAGRVAASLLQAAGLPELVTNCLADYEALALKLARDAVALSAVKAKLARERDTCALFDSVRFARHIESAYRTMWEIFQRGEAPKSFHVEPF
jgi:predicted O-linked N-acetylglucosamine transferase (SPINDLY family)